MKVLVDITEDVFNRINEVNKGSSLSNFILIAIENQISLEKEQQTNFIDFNKKIQKHSEIIKPKNPESKQPQEVKAQIEILNKPLDYEKIREVPLKNPIKNYYIWGQYNKFFAMKFAVRYLAYMQIQNKSAPVKLTEFQNRCSRSASKMKQILKQSDEKAGRIWGEGFSAGLPEDEEKSWSRFIHHFIGYADSQGNQVGSISDIGFIVIDNGSIALSPYGLAFAKIKNPIIDDNPFSPTLFSPEEQQFLINHFKTNIPIEWKAVQTIIQWIESGINTPDTLNAKFSTLDSKWTEKMTNTYRTGMLARMIDLGFISRVKEGINVRYIVTENGKTVVGIT
ncbi:MAG: hypothetical protein ABSB80_05995 [Methanoregula sp.]|jgi:hypothetical protein|uniref:hypothetical protein n=1 Tax=Methanoregula sp. TaxID=2052170 RepID=UPI003D0C2461